MNQEEKEKVAMWKYGLISSVIHRNSTENSETKYSLCRKIAANPLVNPVTGDKKYYSPRTIVWWCDTYQKYGLDGLISRSRNDQGTFRVLEPSVQKRICEILDEFPRLSNIKLRDKLKDEGLIDNSLSQSTIDRFVRIARPEKRLPAIHQGKDRKAFEFEHANECWQADTTFLQQIKGARVCLMVIIDDASRMIVGHGFFYHDNAENFLKVLKDAISRHGKPQKLYLDHGAPYENHQLEMICARADIALSYAPVRDGSAKGKIERLNRTLKEGWLSQVDWKSFSDLSEVKNSFTQFIYPQYINKPHSSLPQNGETHLTPRERFLMDNDLIKRIPMDQLDSLFVLRYDRKVKTDSTISVKNTLYEVPSEFMKQKVEVYIDPLDKDRAWIQDPFSDKRIPIRKLDKHENTYMPRRKHVTYPGMERQ